MKLDFLKTVIDKAGGMENIINEGVKIASGMFSKDDKKKTIPSDTKKANKEESGNIISKGKKLASGLLSNEQNILKDTPSDIKGTTSLPVEPEPARDIELSENMTKEEEERFIEYQRKSLMNAQDVSDALSALNKEVFETIKFCEVQKTKREKIRNDANVRIAEINAMTSCIKDYLNKSFDERDKLFENYFIVLDEAIRSENLTLMSKTLDSINSLAASSPFKALTDINNVSRGLMSGEEWDI